jgi:hypothetical protein
MRADGGSTDTQLARRLGRKGLAGLAAEVALIGIALPLYYLVRGLSHERVAVAFDNANQLIDLERALGIFWEADLQDQVLSYGWLVDTLNAMYLYGHLPVVLVIAVWLHFRHRPQYLLMRNAFLISGAIGLVVYVSFPVAPPRLMPEEFGFTDTVFRQYGVSRVANPWFLRNEYAAVPSLHFGWNLLAAVAVWLASRDVVLRSFVVVMPLATLAAIVLTANHYFLDAVAGLLVIVVGMALALAVRTLVLRYRSGRPGPAEGVAWWGWVAWLGGVPDRPDGQPVSVER